jgi:hypothetical protein
MSAIDMDDNFLYRQLQPLFGVARVPVRLQQALLRDPILIRRISDEEGMLKGLLDAVAGYSRLVSAQILSKI